MGICMTDYPEKSIRNIQTVADRLGVDFDTAYAAVLSAEILTLKQEGPFIPNGSFPLSV